MDSMRIDGVPSIVCDVDGIGPPVVFLHGIGGNRKNWSRQIAAINDAYTGIAWDARGYGESDDYDGSLLFSDFGDDLARLLDHLEIERAHLVGLSMGARILMNFFPRYRERVATLTLCDCFHGFNVLTEDEQRGFLDLREKPLRSGKTFGDLAPALIESLVSPGCSDEARAELHASIVALHVDSYLKTLAATVTFDASADLASIDVPVQLIFGEHDRLTPPSNGEEMVALIPDARLAVLDGAGHLSNIEQPVDFNRVMRAFLDRHSDLASYAAPA